MKLPFDTISLTDEDGERTISLENFLRFSLHKRVRLVLERRVRFSSGSSEVNYRVALASLKELSEEESEE